MAACLTKSEEQYQDVGVVSSYGAPLEICNGKSAFRNVAITSTFVRQGYDRWDQRVRLTSVQLNLSTFLQRKVEFALVLIKRHSIFSRFFGRKLKNRLTMNVRMLCPSEEDGTEQSLKSGHAAFVLGIVFSLERCGNISAKFFPFAYFNVSIEQLWGEINGLWRLLSTGLLARHTIGSDSAKFHKRVEFLSVIHHGSAWKEVSTRPLQNLMERP